LFLALTANNGTTRSKQEVTIMKINGSDLQTRLNVYQTAQMQEKPPQATQAEPPAARTPQQDRVALTERGRWIADVQRAMADVPDVRESLVLRIQTELEQGTYRFDHHQAADGILRESMVNLAAME
jgi:negative regulator of flagellin synthesis FlgM